MKSYEVYLLECDDNTVILCSEEKLNFSDNVIQICNKYKDSKVNEDIINSFGENGEGYVFYAVSNKGNNVVMIEFLIIATLILAIIFIRSKFFQRKSKLGKRLAEFGSYDIIIKEINEQTHNAIYKSGNVIVCKDYIILLETKDTQIMPISNITTVDSKPDEKYPDEIIKIKFIYNDKEYNFDVYDKNTAKKIIEHLKNK